MLQAHSLGRLAAAQLRLALGVAVAYDPPLLGALARGAGGRPRVRETSLVGVPATVYRPGRGRGPWPGVVVFPGVTRLGRAHPAFVGIGRALAASGHVAFVAEPEGAAAGALSAKTLEQGLVAADEAASRPDVVGGRVGLAGVSGGGTLALLASAAPSLASRVAAVIALGPCCDVREGLRAATTGAYRDGGRLRSFVPGELFRLALARTVVSWLPAGPDRDALRARFLALPDYGPEPLATSRSWPVDGLSEDARRALALLSNEDPERFDELVEALPRPVREGLAALSPVEVADRITAPVELLVAREDKYVPPADPVAFMARCPAARVTVLDSLAHAVPSLAPSAALDLARLDGAVVRVLAALRAPSYSRP